MKQMILTVAGAVGVYLSWFFGGWDISLTILSIFILIDYITGLIVAGIFHKSKKSEDGSLSSKAGWKGICKKVITLILVGVANLIDVQLGTQVLRDGVCATFIVNEGLSIIENAGLMGIPIPKFLKDSITLLNSNDKSDK